MSSSRYSAQRSMRPFAEGVPVRPITLFAMGRTRIRTRKRFARWFLNEESSSTTRQSQSNGKPLSSTSHATFSRLTMVMSARFLSASLRSSSVPTATA